TKGHPFDYFSLNIDDLLIVADTGIKGQTREAVKDVAPLFETQPDETGQMIQKLGYLTKQAKQAIIENSPETVAQTMDESQSLLEKLTISNDFLNQLIQTAKD
ncbi:mevalonate kinase, partial [Enterococcus faecium]